MDHSIDLSGFVQAAGDAIIAANRGGTIVFWNPAAERLFGFSANEACGRSLDLIIPERFRQRHWDAYRASMSSGETKYGHELLCVPALHKAGHTLSIAFTVALLTSPNKSVDAIVAIVRDETKRWKEDRELRKRLAELEAKLKSTT